MSYNALLYTHLFTILPCVPLGLVTFFIPKSSLYHMVCGRLYMALMIVTAFVTLFMSATVGPTLFNHFGFLHIFSLLNFYTVPVAILAIKRGNVAYHKSLMIRLYCSAIVLAGGFTLAPGRFMHEFIFN